MRAFSVLLACVLVASCGGSGGGGGNPPAPPATFTLGGTVSGLAGSGLVLRNNGANPLTVTSNGAFTFSGTIASGSAYNVTVGVQPTSVSQTCVVGAGVGTATANVTNVAVTCTTTTFAVGVTVDGLFGTGLVLENNGTNPLTINANGAATFSTNIASGAAYNVAVRTQPTSTPTQTCTVSSATGSVGNGPVGGIVVSCRAQAGRFVYVAVAGATSAANGVAVFAIDTNTGTLAPITGSPFATAGQAPRVVAADPTGRFLYVWGDDNTTSPGATTLEGFTVDAQTGALTPIPGVVSLSAAAGVVAFHPNGRFFYLPVTDGGPSGNNQVRGFAINQTTGVLASLTPWGPFGAGDVINGVVLSPSGANLYLAHLTPANPPSPAVGTIRQLAVDPQTGELSATTSQASEPTVTFNQMFMHPSGTHLYTRNTAPIGSGAMTSRYPLDVTTGAIGTKTNIGTAFGFGVSFAPQSRVYFAEFGGSFATPAPGSFSGYTDSASAAPAALPGSPWLTGGTNSISQALDPTGRFLALTNTGSHDVTVMKIDAATGSLAHVPGSPFVPAVGVAPGSVRFDPSARFAYLTDAAGSISSYAVDVDTGHPTFVSSQLTTGGSPAVVPVVILGRQ